MKNNNETKKKKSRLKLLISISISSFLFIISVCLILLSTILTDKTKSTHQNSGNEITEIIKENYLKSFKNTRNSGVFSFSMDENDVNDLFDKKNENISNKYVSKMYYQTKENHHYFCIELKRTFLIKSRIVFDAVPVSVNDDFSYNLGIVSCKMGKANALPLLAKRNLLKEDVFESEYLPIKYNAASNLLVVSPLKLIDYFPKSDISDLFFDVAKGHLDLFSLNGTLFGFNIDFSKLVTDNRLPEIDNSAELNFYNDLKTSCEAVDFSSLSIGEQQRCYSINEDTLTTLFGRSVPDNKKEIIKSTLSDNEVVFDLVVASVTMKDDNKMDVSLFYSLNGYIVDVINELTFIDSSSTFYNAFLESKPRFKIGNYIYEGSENISVNKVSNDVSNIFAKIAENQSDFFSFNESKKSLEINLKTMNDNFSDLDLKFSQKNINVNSIDKRLDFVVTKSA